MINSGQNAKYWRRWAMVCRVNHWRMVKGRLSAEAKRDTGQHHAAVWQLAENLANGHCRAVTADDLRHACHVHVAGRDLSHDDFTNEQFDRLLLLWGNERDFPGLLINPDHVLSQMFWDDPLLAKKDRLIRSIKALAKDEYICRITADIWGTIFWEDNLDYEALRGLFRKLKGNRPT
jgi:hypothetical protein